MKKTIIVIISIIGGCFLLLSMPKIFTIMVGKTIDWLTGGIDPKFDSSGRMIHQDGRHTIASFGIRKEFAIEKCGGGDEISWYLCNRDSPKDIDKIRYFTRSFSFPCIYALGEKGYTKLNYETAEINQSENLAVFSEEDQEIFKKLECKQISAENEQEKSEISWRWINS